MAKKHKAFGIVRREIAKKIRLHRRARRKVAPKKRKKFDLAIRKLQALSKALAWAWNSRISCPRY